MPGQGEGGFLEKVLPKLKQTGGIVWKEGRGTEDQREHPQWGARRKLRPAAELCGGVEAQEAGGDAGEDQTIGLT